MNGGIDDTIRAGTDSLLKLVLVIKHDIGEIFGRHDMICSPL
jgi:hypothetical protein